MRPLSGIPIAWPAPHHLRPLRIVGEARVLTESTLWLIRSDEYIRMPKAELPRRPPFAFDHSLDDLIWIPYREIRLMHSQFGTHLRIIPASRGRGSNGVITGVIVESEPPLGLFLDG